MKFPNVAVEQATAGVAVLSVLLRCGHRHGCRPVMPVIDCTDNPATFKVSKGGSVGNRRTQTEALVRRADGRQRRPATQRHCNTVAHCTAVRPFLVLLVVVVAAAVPPSVSGQQHCTEGHHEESKRVDDDRDGMAAQTSFYRGES